MKTAFFIFLAMLAFAGNSFICRLALASNAIDPVSFTSIRLISGALGLMLIVLMVPIVSASPSSSRSLSEQTSLQNVNKSNIIGSLMLFIYAILFSLAYIKLDAGVGALLLFASVQLTMLGFNIVNGGKLSLIEAMGMFIASLGLIVLLAPNEFSPDVNASALMVLSGIAWAFYTLNGQSRSANNPTVNTAKNFLLTMPWVLLSLVMVYYFSHFDNTLNLSLNGVLLAVISGVVTSALGYSIWYAVLPKISITIAACAQLSVPVLAAIGGFILIDETLTWRFLIATILTLSGIAITVFAKKTV